MRLEQEAPGRWVNRDWVPGTAGAFALIAGVSAYPHLRGKATYDLESLYVSALTAFRVFEWLRGGYRRRGCPVAKCWLLLAPTQDELATVPAMHDAYADATFNGIKLAIQEWTQTMKTQGGAARSSRGFFFFSGHGVEVRSDHQVLLPSDYLAPPNPSLNDAISTNNLFRGLLSDPVPLHLLFLDACRNDHDALMSEGIEGARILNTGGKRNTGVIVDLFRATASGLRAWQPDQASAGESVFGQALLEGLKNRKLKECASGECWIPVYALQKFVNGRVMEILKSYQALVESPVRLGGEVDDAVVTELPADVLPSGPDLSHPPGPDDRQPPTDLVDVALQHKTTFEAWSPKAEGFAGLLKSASHDVQTEHDVYGSERMQEIWEVARVYDLKHRRWFPEGREYVLHRFERDEARRLFRAVLSVPNADGPCALELRQTWMPQPMKAGKALVPRTFTCVLPFDVTGPVKYSVLLNLEYRSDDPSGQASAGLGVSHSDIPYRWLSRVDVDLAVDNPDALGLAARLWQRYRRGGFRDAFASTEFAELLRDGRGESTLAPLVLGTIALRGRARDRVSVFADLARHAPDMPDAAVFRAEELSRLELTGPWMAERPVDWLMEMSARGVPWTGEALSMALTLVEDQLADSRGWFAEANDMKNLQQRLEGLVRAARSVGGFCSVFADLENIGLLQPTPRVQAYLSPSTSSVTAAGA